MSSHYNYNDKNIQTTTVTVFLIPSRSNIFEARTTTKHFQPIKIEFKGQGCAFHFTSMPAEVMAQLAKQLS